MLPAHDRDEGERAARHVVGRNDAWYVEPLRERGAVAVVPVEELDHPDRLSEGECAIDRLRPVERVDQPDLPIRGKRMRRAGHRLFGNPAEAL